MKLSFLSLASGSSGNCYYLGTSEFGMLIDAGIGIRTIKKVLKDRSIDFTKIVAVLITHDHADHIKTVGYLGEKLCIPVYATADVHRGIDKSRYVEETLCVSRKVIEKEVPFLIRDFRITAFEVPHDSTDNVGYHIEYGNHKFTFATDVGHITDTVGKYIPTGHLSNREAAEFLATHYNTGLKNIWLCHLSRDNNHPELAYKTVDIRLFQEGIRVGKDVSLVALKRTTPSDIYEFD